MPGGRGPARHAFHYLVAVDVDEIVRARRRQQALDALEFEDGPRGRGPRSDRRGAHRAGGVADRRGGIRAHGTRGRRTRTRGARSGRATSARTSSTSSPRSRGPRCAMTARRSGSASRTVIADSRSRRQALERYLEALDGEDGTPDAADRCPTESPLGFVPDGHSSRQSRAVRRILYGRPRGIFDAHLPPSRAARSAAMWRDLRGRATRAENEQAANDLKATAVTEGERIGPLAGIRVIELGTLLAGPFTGRLLGDLGAEIIKVEAPGQPDPIRNWGKERYKGRSLWWPVQSRNKKCITLNLREEKGQELLLRLVERRRRRDRELPPRHPRAVESRVRADGRRQPRHRARAGLGLRPDGPVRGARRLRLRLRGDGRHSSHQRLPRPAAAADAPLARRLARGDVRGAGHPGCALLA